MELKEIEYLLMLIKLRLTLLNNRINKQERTTNKNKFIELSILKDEKISCLRLSKELRESLYKYKSPDAIHQSKRIYSSLEEKNKGLYK